VKKGDETAKTFCIAVFFRPRGLGLGFFWASPDTWVLCEGWVCFTLGENCSQFFLRL
jgi:hypothetical protein